ncbi:hypothetical protein HNP37_003017 [Flavobacterium nitrogenifigens]|uniref:Uncharacterized protein n=2 Tax=Flavobacterium TaxID=237 RepID=A0A7W7IYM6_9FLAO|nr:hypothetical protein [Flavobacterium nitrogenifigens]MBB6387900.1 hypothetical protein [Flavobacterium notoginsengisoli]
MKIRPTTNHSSWKIDYNHFSSKKIEDFLSPRDETCSMAYFDMPNST